MKKYYLFLLSTIVGLIGLSAVLLACGIDTEFTSSHHRTLVFLGWCAFAIAYSIACKRIGTKGGVGSGAGWLMNVVALATLLLGFSIPIQPGKVIFGVLGVIVLTLICLIRYLIRRWMAWLKAP